LKFFFKETFIKYNLKLNNKQNWNKKFLVPSTKQNFNNFIFKNGSATKNKLILYNVYKNINYFLYNNSTFLFEHYPQIKGLLENFLNKKMNATQLVNTVMDGIKPPFVVKSILIPKKLRKKTKQKYLIKIVYKNENKRLNSSYKQLYYYSNKFSDRTLNVRLYKALLFSFLEWKNSHLFKLKGVIFKKFFKF